MSGPCYLQQISQRLPILSYSLSSRPSCCLSSVMIPCKPLSLIPPYSQSLMNLRSWWKAGDIQQAGEFDGWPPSAAGQGNRCCCLSYLWCTILSRGSLLLRRAVGCLWRRTGTSANFWRISFLRDGVDTRRPSEKLAALRMPIRFTLRCLIMDAWIHAWPEGGSLFVQDGSSDIATWPDLLVISLWSRSHVAVPGWHGVQRFSNTRAWEGFPAVPLSHHAIREDCARWARASYYSLA